ncbi:MAG TPA: zinc-ribbon domain-containing protein [Clostridiales bacterium]|nr:zinc-ribbon domain-containing protein [Clostridiales bacterium]
MAFCVNCGTQMDENTKVCPSCGTEAGQSPAAGNPVPPPSASQPNLFQKLNDTAETTAEYDPKDIADNKLMAALSYIGILVLIPWLAAPNSRFVRYHARQGLTLFIAYIAYFVIRFLLGLIKTTRYAWGIPYQTTPGIILFISWLIGIPLFILSVIGIINVIQGRAKELPVIGKLNIVK